jgi:hypothetical protein
MRINAAPRIFPLGQVELSIVADDKTIAQRERRRPQRVQLARARCEPLGRKPTIALPTNGSPAESAIREMLLHPNLAAAAPDVASRSHR